MSVDVANHPDFPTARPVLDTIRGHPMPCFFLLAYAGSWLGWLPYVLSPDGVGVLPFHVPLLAIIPAGYLGPLLSAFVMTGATEGRAGVLTLLRRFVQWRVGILWFLIALFAIPLLRMLGALALPGVLPTFHFPALQVVLLYPVVLTGSVLINGLAEEPGWRGFALPRLQRKHGPLAGTIVLGLLWAGWHAPLFLTRAAPLGGGMLTLIAWAPASAGVAIIITWVFNHTRGSLLIAMLLHGAVDVSAPSALFAHPQVNGPLPVLIGIGAGALLLTALTRRRLGYEENAGTPPATHPLTAEGALR